MAQYARPSSDISTNSWTTTPLYEQINEASYSDTDYIQRNAIAYINVYDSSSITDTTNNELPRYWVGGTGNWSDTAHWSETSNGTGGASVPTSSNNVYFDANSGSGTVTFDTEIYCFNFDAGNSSILTFVPSSPQRIYGNLTLPSGGSWVGGGKLYFKSSGGIQEITTNGVAIYSYYFRQDYTSNIKLMDDLTTNALYLESDGKFDVNGHNVTINCGVDGGNTYFLASNTYVNLTINGNSSRSDGALYTSGNNTITGTLTINGYDESHRLLVNSSILGTAKTFTAENVSLSYVDFRDITAAGTSADWTGTSLGDAGGNTNIIFDTPVNRYWVATSGGNWADTSSWATTSNGTPGASIPLCHDTAIFDNNSITYSDKTITLNVYSVGNVNFSNVLNSPTLSYANQCYFYGDLYLGSGMTVSGNYSTYFYKRGALNLTQNGVNLYSNTGYTSYFYLYGGSLTLSENLISNGTVNFYNGIIDFNNYDVTVGACSFNNSSSGGEYDAILGSGTITVKRGNFEINSSSIKADVGTAHIIYDGDYTYATSFRDITGKVFDHLTIESGRGTVQFVFGEYIKDLTVGEGCTITFYGGRTFTFSGNIDIQGTEGNLITIESTSTTNAILSYTGEDYATIGYVDIDYITGTPDLTWYAGAHSIDGGNNSQIYFTDAPIDTIYVSDDSTVSDVPIVGTPNMVVYDSTSVTESVTLYRDSELYDGYEETTVSESVSISIPTLHISIFDATTTSEEVSTSIPTLHISVSDEIVTDDSVTLEVTPKLIFTYEESEITEYTNASSGVMGIDDVNVTENVEVSITSSQSISSKALIRMPYITNGAIFLWPGLASNIPSGWERVTELNSYFIKGMGPYGNIENNSISSLSTLKGYWKFISGSGTVDYSGLSHNLETGGGTVTYTNTIFGGGAVFDGSSYLINTDHSDFDVGNTFSISGRIKTTQSDTGYFFGTYGGDYAGFCVGVVSGKLSIRLGGTSPNLIDFASTTSINDGDEHHFVITFDKPDLKVYIDGEIDNTDSFNYTIATNSRDLHFGKAPWYANYFTGTLGDLAIWNGTELTSTQVTNLFNEYIETTSGGSSTHTHTSPTHTHTMINHTHTITLQATGGGQSKNNAGSGTGFRQNNHAHANYNSGNPSNVTVGESAVTYSSVSNNPPYQEFIFITPSFGSDTIPNEAIYFYEDTDTKTGHYICDGSSTSPVLGTYATGLKGYWKFESGATTTDSSGSSHPWVPTTAASEFLNGKYGGALSFYPSPQYYTIANQADFNPSTLSISFWVNTTTSTYNGMIFTKYGGDYTGWMVRVAPNGKAIFTIGNGPSVNKDASSTSTINDGRWHHVACVFNGTDLRVYVDGQLDCTPLASGALVNNTRDVYLGKASWYDDNYMHGIVDDLAYWNGRSLTANEVEAIYNSGASAIPNINSVYIKGSSTSANAGIIGGSTVNVHDISHSHTVSHQHASATSGVGTNGCGVPTSVHESVVACNHTHAVTLSASTTGTATTDIDLTTTETVEPAHTKLLAVQNKSGSAEFRKNVIGLWIDTLSTIPSNFELMDGVDTTDMRGRYIKTTTSTGSIGATGGSNTHTHASQNHNHAAVSHYHARPAQTHTAGSTVGDGSTLYGESASTTHAANNSSTNNYTLNTGSTSANSSSNEPQYKTTAFIKLSFLQYSQNIQAKAQIVSGPSAYDETTVTDEVYVFRDSEDISVYDELDVTDAVETSIPILHINVNDESEVTDEPEIDEGHEFIDVYDDVNITEDISILITTRQDITARGNISNPVWTIPNGVIFIWTGDNNAIPEGWERVTTLDNRYIKGTTVSVDPNVPGGNTSHTHTSPTHTHTHGTGHTHTLYIGTGTGGGRATDDGSNGKDMAHAHANVTSGAVSNYSCESVAVTYGTVSNDPPYYTVIFITPEIGASTIPNGAIYAYGDTDSVSNHYICDGNNSTPTLTDKFLKGANTDSNPRSTGGSTTNVHAINHDHTVQHQHAAVTSGAPSTGSNRGAIDESSCACSWNNHTHSVTAPNYSYSSTYNGSLTTDETVQPAYKNLLAIQNRTGDSDYRIGMIAMWLGSLNDIPYNYSLCDGTNGTIDMRGQYLKVTSTSGNIGNTGGSNTHTHAAQSHSQPTQSHSHSGNLYHTQNYCSRNSGYYVATTGTYHPITSSTSTLTLNSATTTANSSSNEPSYRTVAFIKLQYLLTEKRISAKAFIEPAKIVRVNDSAVATEYVEMWKNIEDVDVHDNSEVTENIDIRVLVDIRVNDDTTVTDNSTLHIPILHIDVNDETEVIDDVNVGGETITAKASIKVFDVERTITAKANLMTKAWKTVEARARINRTYTQTIYVKANIFRTGIINPPIFGDITMPFPSEANINPIWEYCENTVLKGTTYRGYRARKYEYSMKWKYMRVIDYNNLKNKVDELEPQIFTFGKWPQSVNGVLCFSTLSARRLEVGTGDSDYWSSVSIKLVEVNSRI